MIDCRILPSITRPALLAIALTCALGRSALADPVPSHDYPPTYSSHKSPWYDPFGIFSSSDKKPGVPTQSTTTTSLPLPATSATVSPVISTPAWKWYGYGTPTPGQNPMAPNGNYPTVPGNWYTSSGTTPGAQPLARIGGSPIPGVVPDPVPTPPRTFGAEHVSVIPPNGPILPDATIRTPIEPPPDVSWQSSPARLRVPAGDSFASEDDRPRASLRAPVPINDSVPVGSPAPSENPVSPPAPPRKPGEQSPSPDLPVEPAPDIVSPPMAGSVSKAVTPVTARAVAPAIEIPPSVVAAVRRACDSNVRLMQIDRTGTKRMVVRLSGTPEAALAVRSRLASDPGRAGWRVEFELVTALGR